MAPVYNKNTFVTYFPVRGWWLLSLHHISYDTTHKYVPGWRGRRKKFTTFSFNIQNCCISFYESTSSWFTKFRIRSSYLPSLDAPESQSSERQTLQFSQKAYTYQAIKRPPGKAYSPTLTVPLPRGYSSSIHVRQPRRLAYTYTHALRYIFRLEIATQRPSQRFSAYSPARSHTLHY